MDHEIKTSPSPPPLQKHPVYIEGMAHLNAGRWNQAFEAFQLLQGVYPDSTELKELIDQVQMRATMVRFQPKNDSGDTKRVFRRLAVGVFILVILAGIAYAAYEFWINPVLIQELRVRQITRLRNSADEAIASGNYAQARQDLEELLAILPEDPEAIEALDRVEQVERLAVLYTEAKALMDAGSWDQAVDVLTELQSLDAQYRDLSQLLEVAKESQALNEQFQTAEDAFANEDWAAAIAQYEALQRANLTFKFEEVQARLFDSHLRYGQILLEEAGDDPTAVEKGLEHISQALKLKPIDDQALTERQLAETYLAALNSEAQDEVIDLLHTVYDKRSDYASGAVAQLLYIRLLERADSALEAGDEAAGIADYQLAVQLSIEDISEAHERLTELTSED